MGSSSKGGRDGREGIDEKGNKSQRFTKRKEKNQNKRQDIAVCCCCCCCYKKKKKGRPSPVGRRHGMGWEKGGEGGGKVGRWGGARCKYTRAPLRVTCALYNVNNNNNNNNNNGSSRGSTRFNSRLVSFRFVSFRLKNIKKEEEEEDEKRLCLI